MTIELFDVQAHFGSAQADKRHLVEVDELKSEMQRMSIARSLVRICSPVVDTDFAYTNSRLFEACAGDESLVPCPVVVPNSGYDLASEEEQVQEAINHASGAVSIRPGPDSWLLLDWVCDKLFRALEARQMPVFCHCNNILLDALADLAKRYPTLPLVLAGAAYTNQRIYLPLMETFPNIHLSLGNRYAVHMGIEQLVDKIGPKRLLFGSAFPNSEVMPSITMLTYADISNEAKNLIGAQNMERLMKGIVQ